MTAAVRRFATILGMLFLAIFAQLPSHASSAGFVLSAQNIELGAPEDAVENNQAQPPRYATKIEQGQTFTLLAQGRAYARGGKAEGSPMAPDSARWRFDDEDFKLIAHDAKEFDASISALRLQAQTIGRTRIRFSGTVLGYKRSFDIVVDIIAPKPE